jgi:hypothetical protein
MLLKSSKFGTVDVLASCGLAGASTYLAATHPSYRVSFNKNKTNVSFAEDARFIIGSSALIYSQLYAPDNWMRPLNDIGLGLLSSFFSTEIVRQISISRMKEVETVMSEGNIIEEDDLGSPSFNAWTEESPAEKPISYSFGF